MTEYETIKRRHSHALRGLREVQTDKAGRELINEAVRSFNLIVSLQERHISQIEMDNGHLMLVLSAKTEQMEFGHLAIKLLLLRKAVWNRIKAEGKIIISGNIFTIR